MRSSEIIIWPSIPGQSTSATPARSTASRKSNNPFPMPTLARFHQARIEARKARAAGARRSLMINLHGEIDTATVASVRRQLNAAPHAETLQLQLSSPGGDVATAFAIYWLLCEHPAAKKRCHVTGRCHSAAIIPLIAADYRSADPSARIHIHFTASVPNGTRLTAEELLDSAENVLRADAAILDLLERRTGADRRKLAAALKADKAMPIAQALHLGLLHHVDGIGEPCRRDFPKQMATADRAGKMAASSRRMLTAQYLAACRVAPLR